MVLALKSSGEAAETLEVVDVAQLLVRSVQIGTSADDGGTAAHIDKVRR